MAKNVSGKLRGIMERIDLLRQIGRTLDQETGKEYRHRLHAGQAALGEIETLVRELGHIWHSEPRRPAAGLDEEDPEFVEKCRQMFRCVVKAPRLPTKADIGPRRESYAAPR